MGCWGFGGFGGLGGWGDLGGFVELEGWIVGEVEEVAGVGGAKRGLGEG